MWAEPCGLLLTVLLVQSGGPELAPAAPSSLGGWPISSRQEPLKCVTCQLGTSSRGSLLLSRPRGESSRLSLLLPQSASWA